MRSEDIISGGGRGSALSADVGVADRMEAATGLRAVLTLIMDEPMLGTGRLLFIKSALYGATGLADTLVSFLGIDGIGGGGLGGGEGW